jgi:hypothetical protein
LWILTSNKEPDLAVNPLNGISLCKKRVLSLLILLALIPTTFVNVNAYTLGEYCTCRAVQNESPYGYIGKTSEFTTRDTIAFVWVKLYRVERTYTVRFSWFMIKDSGSNITRHTHSWKINQEGYSSVDWTTWDLIPIGTRDSIGRWGVSFYIDGNRAFELQFTVKKDPYLIETTETETDTVFVWSTLTASSTSTIITTSTQYSFHFLSVLPFPLDAIVIVSLVAFSSYSTYKWTRARAIASTRQSEAFVEYLARLEDLRSRNEISQATYEKLKDEYWTRMRNSAGSPASSSYLHI